MILHLIQAWILFFWNAIIFLGIGGSLFCAAWCATHGKKYTIRWAVIGFVVSYFFKRFGV